ncbi:MAG: hypothetical protein AAGA92_03150 [Planctomycetota bacterium]
MEAVAEKRPRRIVGLDNPQVAGALPSVESRLGAAGESAVFATILANALIVANTLLRAGGHLLLMPLMITLLGAQQCGLWITICTVTMYLSLSESGLGQTIVNRIGQAYTQGRLEAVGQITATAHVLYWILVGSIGSVAVACVYWFPIGRLLLADSELGYESTLRVCLVVSTVLALSRIPMLVFPAVLMGTRRLPLRLWWELLGTAASLAATAAAILAGFGLLGATVAFNSVLLVSAAAISFSSNRLGDWARLRVSRFDPSLLRGLTSSSFFFFLISASGVIERSVAALMVPRLDSLAAAPAFFLLTNLSRGAGLGLITGLPRAAQPYVVMWSTHGDQARLASSAKLLTKLSALASVLGVAVFAPFAESFVDAWLGPGSYPGDLVFWLIAMSFLCDALFCTPVLFLMAMDCHQRLAVCVAVKAVLAALLALACGSWGSEPLAGIAAGSLLGSILGFVAVPPLVQRALALGWPSYLNHFLARPIIYALVVTGLAWAATPLALQGQPAVVCCLWAGCLLAAWRWVLDAEDRGALLGVVGSLLRKKV